MSESGPWTVALGCHRFDVVAETFLRPLFEERGVKKYAQMWSEDSDLRSFAADAVAALELHAGRSALPPELWSLASSVAEDRYSAKAASEGACVICDLVPDTADLAADLLAGLASYTSDDWSSDSLEALTVTAAKRGAVNPAGSRAALHSCLSTGDPTPTDFVGSLIATLKASDASESSLALGIAAGEYCLQTLALAAFAECREVLAHLLEKTDPDESATHVSLGRYLSEVSGGLSSKHRVLATSTYLRLCGVEHEDLYALRDALPSALALLAQCTEACADSRPCSLVIGRVVALLTHRYQLLGNEMDLQDANDLMAERPAVRQIDPTACHQADLVIAHPLDDAAFERVTETVRGAGLDPGSPALLVESCNYSSTLSRARRRLELTPDDDPALADRIADYVRLVATAPPLLWMLFPYGALRTVLDTCRFAWKIDTEPELVERLYELHRRIYDSAMRTRSDVADDADYAYVRSKITSSHAALLMRQGRVADAIERIEHWRELDHGGHRHAPTTSDSSGLAAQFVVSLIREDPIAAGLLANFVGRWAVTAVAAFEKTAHETSGQLERVEEAVEERGVALCYLVADHLGTVGALLAPWDNFRGLVEVEGLTSDAVAALEPTLDSMAFGSGSVGVSSLLEAFDRVSARGGKQLGTALAQRNYLDIVGVGPWASFPLHALYVGEQPAADANALEVLDDRTELRPLTHGTAAPYRACLHPGQHAIVIADPRTPRYPALPFAAIEGAAVANLLRSEGLTVHLLQGEEATLDALDDAFGAIHHELNLMHFACHGTRRGADETPALELVDARLDSSNLGPLVHRVDGALPALLYLSACDSAVGGWGDQDQFAGFGDFCLSHGTSNVVMNRWPVSDLFALLGTIAFYRELIDSHDIAAAARSARTRLRSGDLTETLHDVESLLPTALRSDLSILARLSGGLNAGSLHDYRRWASLTLLCGTPRISTTHNYGGAHHDH